ncbi:hypothetical protein RDABS01_002910 [Bienertia sinuspersici]
MANFRTDTPTCRRIARAFLDFLDSVEPAPGVDPEGLEVARDCLTEVFRLHQLSESERPEPNQLINFFSSQEKNTECEATTSHNEEARTGPSTQNHVAGDFSGASNVQDDVGVRENNDTGMSKDELFGHFFAALEKFRFFRTTVNGDEDHVLLDRATRLFHDAVNDSRNQAGSPPFASVAFDAGTLPANFASMFANMAGNGPPNQNGQGGPAENNHGTQFPFASTNFDSNTLPPDIANMFMNMTGSTFQGQSPQTRSAEQNHENGPTNNTNPLSNFANMFMNMAGNGSQQQSSQAQPQANINVSDEPVGGVSFSFNSYEQMPEELDSTVRSMLGMFARGSQGDPQNDGNGRSSSG